MNTPILLASIWAEDTQGLIGTGTGMLWRVPADMAFFKSATMGAPLVMGRATWEALGGPLPGRDNIVITRQPDYVAPGATVAHSVAAALDVALASAYQMGSGTVWIAGGAQIYAETMDVVDELFVTELDLTVTPMPKRVAVAPHIDPEVWQLDPQRSDDTWRELSGDARWKLCVYIRKKSTDTGAPSLI